ncbi:amino acid transporter [Myriangium duriaei CBS 260.36]|uniref:Amino acid transporter n=1 Tax=Myriangium duriaei CBS 260.36 TaxID=1168546 RepID=A0A9P4MLN5_9PEZI|nr:amino acid transporter [Myriangium duriaei CBS 260.36]
MTRRRSTIKDDEHLAALGHKAELHRQFSPLAMLGLAFTILNTWTALSASLSLALPSGGSVSVIWGFVTAGFCNLCIAASLAEFIAAYPTAGGQYHWVAALSPPAWRPVLSYITGYVNTAGWIALIAAGGSLGAQFIFGIVTLQTGTFKSTGWQQFLVYSAYNLISFLFNAFGNHHLHIFNSATMFWSIAGFFIICITALATAAPKFNSADTVFRLFINSTGWPDGIAFLLGLLQGGFSLTAYDSVAHMVEEIPNAAVKAPRIIIEAVAIGLFTGFIFLVCMLFAGGSIDDIISSPYGPLLQILYTATNSNAGSICLLIFPIACLLNATVSVQTTATRMTWAFARDHGLPASRVFAKVHPKLKMPLNALILTSVLTTIFGLVLIGSSSALSAIVSASVVALGVSYGIPIAINVARRRRALPPTRSFVLPGPLGWICNIVGLVYTIVTTILFLFPPAYPATPSSMNYCVVAFGVVIIIAVAQWFIDSRKTYTGPIADVDPTVLTAEHTLDGVQESPDIETQEATKGGLGDVKDRV